ncbi:MAG: DUF948 domain-containing protein [Desulfobulbaceae bacterium]|nr:DUF948 domain-containing protein [Desulfobulbaceae bacterium]
MAFVDIFYLTASISLIAVIIVLIPAIAQLRRTAQKAETAIETINRDMDPLLTKITEVSEELHVLSASLNEKIDKTDNIIDTLQRAGEHLLFTTTAVKETVTPVVAQIGGISAGISAFARFFKKSEPSSKRSYFDEQRQ